MNLISFLECAGGFRIKSRPRILKRFVSSGLSPLRQPSVVREALFLWPMPVWLKLQRGAIPTPGVPGCAAR